MSMHPEETYEMVRRHRHALLSRASWREQPFFPAAPADAAWSQFGDEQATLQHRRRLLVAKFNPAVWGDPLDPDLWRAGHEESWLWDAYAAGPRRGGGDPARSTAVLRNLRAGDLIVPMSLGPNRGDHRLLGVWMVVLVHRWIDPLSPMRAMSPGHRARVATEVWHLPLVRFSVDVVVDVIRGRDRALDLSREFTERNDMLVEVADADGGRTAAARLLAACSLPGELLTCPDPLALRPLLAAKRTGMRDADQRYWQDMQYRHLLRCATEYVAVERSQTEMLKRGYDFPDCWDHQGESGWGGDFECWSTTTPGERLAVEVKGTRKRKWFGSVKLEQSQYDRAVRHANGRPLLRETGYGWELHVQPGLPMDVCEPDLATLPQLEVRSSAFVRDTWPESCVNKRRRHRSGPLTPANGHKGTTTTDRKGGRALSISTRVRVLSHGVAAERRR